ncbi:transport and Golgi organization protein 1 homolog isoform X2 [Mugil cephalus]|uniref:transport and Golgi organization protein 1 homolog isoform X2 n=1 Tax=Mugil cephalus TaxID=48193 RepID=UPI001FB6D6AE|nr:transport and Golgi organization protein 1 homolog isoform X2 [Mugil cephalus]
MAAKHFYRQGLLLLLFNFICTAALEKRFSDFKRCADEECSMLLCRGKAVKDFVGPDCRFLSFQASETIYVYYKLAGRRSDLWAGSVGSHFGYFPKDLLALNHLYTDKEIEVPAEETDFVCFDTGFDKFDNYNVDLLLGLSEEENDDENKEISDPVAEEMQKETQPSKEEEVNESEKQAEHHDNPEDAYQDHDDQSASLPDVDISTHSPPVNVVESHTAANPDATEGPDVTGAMPDANEGAAAPTAMPDVISSTPDANEGPDATEEAEEVEEVEETHEPMPFVKKLPDVSETKETPVEPEVESVPKDENVSEFDKVSVSEGVQIPELKTTLGTTYDAVTTDEEITKKVTPYEEEESDEVGDLPEEHIDEKEETPLLTFSEEPVTTPPSDFLKTLVSPPTTQGDEPKAAEEQEEKNMWTSIGDAVFSVVTGGERTQDVSLEEEDEDQEDEQVATKPPQGFEEAKKDPLSVEPPKDSENLMRDTQDPANSSSVQSDSDSEKLLFEDESVEEVTKPKEDWDEALKPNGEPINQTEETTVSEDPVSPDSVGNPEDEKSDIIIAHEPTVDKEEEKVTEDSGVNGDKINEKNTSVEIEQDNLDNSPDENQTVTDQENDQSLFIEETNSNDSDVKDDKDTIVDSIPNTRSEHLVTDLESNNSRAESFAEEPENHEEPHSEEIDSGIEDDLGSEGEDEKYAQAEEREDDINAQMEDGSDDEKYEEKEELLEDENALSSSQSDTNNPSPEMAQSTVSTPEPEYSESVLRLTLLREHFSAESMERVQRFLGLQNLFRVEAMFSDLDTELQATRLSSTGSTQDIENALEAILEASENTILDEIEKMLDSRETKQDYDHHKDASSLDEETEILDDFQELAFSLRQKYSTVSDSTPVAPEKPSDQVEHELNVQADTPHVEEEKLDHVPESDDNLTVADGGEKPDDIVEETTVLDEVPAGPDVSVEEDGGHFNKNKDDQPSFSASDEMPKVPQATLENPLDMGLGEVEHLPSGSMDTMEQVSEMHEEKEEEEQEEVEEEVGLFSTGIVYTGCIVSMIKNKTAEWTTVMISLLPEEWRPGETLFGCPWQAVIFTALVGVVTFTLFFWRTILAVKKREYLVDSKRLTEQIQALKKEKNDVLAKMSELQKQTEQLKENQKQSKETVSCTVKKLQNLESKVLEAETLNEQIAQEKNKYAKLLEEEQANSLQNETRIEKLEKSNEKLQLSRKKIQDALAKTTVLLDEAKIREDARTVQHKCLEKEFAALKEENKTLKATIKDWEGKHKELNEKIKVYQKAQKELEDSVVLKDHNVEVLSELLADLDACDLQKGDARVLANGEVAPDKKTAIKNRIKQMMDVSRVQTTLSVVEEERDRFMTKLLNEEKSRKELEEQHRELELAIATLKSDKSHVENQFKILQQKNEIMVEMYQQKENALQQKLTKEELERRSKESLLSEVGGKALEAEEQVKVLRQRINEMEEQMKKTEEVYKEQIKEQENKTHSNWVNARNAERALNQEKLEASKLREKLAVLTSQLNERRAPLFRPNSGQPAGPRQGDSYGPSPVSGGAPSPPLMIEGPRRPPSAPVGRRIDPYGPRPPSDPHGRYPDNKHISGMDMMGPRSSSPANLDGSTQDVDPQIKAEAQAEASTENPEPGPGSFLASPIRDSPGPHDPLLPPGPHGRLPPPGPYRAPRPGPYHHLPPGPPPPNVPPPLHGPPLPANGHPGMPLPGPMVGEFGPRPANGLAFHPRPGPGHVIDPRGPPPPHFRPPPPHPYGPLPPPHGVRGPMGPRPPLPPDMRFPGPRSYPGPPMDLPPGVPPHPSHPGEAYGRPAPPSALQNSTGPHSGPGQDLQEKQEAPQDSARPEMVKP